MSYSMDCRLKGFDLGNEYLHDTIKQLVTGRNTASPHYTWTVMAVTTNGERINCARGVGVVLKGETLTG